MRAYKDFREFLGVLDQEKQLLRITDPMQPEPDLAAAAAAVVVLAPRRAIATALKQAAAAAAEGLPDC